MNNCPQCGHDLLDHYPSTVEGQSACLPCMDDSTVCLVPNTQGNLGEQRPSETDRPLWGETRP